MPRQDPKTVINLFNQAKTLRAMNEPDWRIASAYCLPRHYSMWSTDGPPVKSNGAAATRRIAYDSTASRALPKYAAVLERIATPHNMLYQNLMATDATLMKSRRVREYLQALRDLIFKYRYGTKANFGRTASETWLSLGAYGTGPFFLGQRTPNALFKGQSFIYRACPLRDIYILVNDEGEIVAVFRRFWLNCRQFKEKWPQEPLPPCIARRATAGKAPNEEDMFEFIHYVCIRGEEDYDPEAIDYRRMPIMSNYLSVTDQQYVGEEQGYRSMPYLTPRTATEAGNAYGYAPSLQSQAAMGTASAMKKTMIKQGQKAVDPVILTHDDGVMNGGVDQRPGAVNPGGLDKQGRKLIDVLPTGNFNVGEKLIQDEREDINDSFFVTLFQILMETPEMTAAEVYERVAERASLIAPTMNAIQDEMLAPQTMREIDILQEMGLVADGPKGRGLQMPPELIEAKGEYDIVYTSPMAKAMYAEEVSGFMRSVEMSLKLAEATQDPSHLDHYDFDTAIPEMSDYMNTPARWMNDEAKKRAKQEERNKRMQEAQLLQNSGQLASVAKNVAAMQQEK
jgi:hypothetical protein